MATSAASKAVDSRYLPANHNTPRTSHFYIEISPNPPKYQSLFFILRIPASACLLSHPAPLQAPTLVPVRPVPAAGQVTSHSELAGFATPQLARSWVFRHPEPDHPSATSSSQALAPPPPPNLQYLLFHPEKLCEPRFHSRSLSCRADLENLYPLDFNPKHPIIQTIIPSTFHNGKVFGPHPEELGVLLDSPHNSSRGQHYR